MMQFFLFDLLGADPIKVITLAGVCLIGGGLFSLFIKDAQTVHSNG